MTPHSKLPYAESVNYWQTGRSDPDTWIAKTTKLLREVGGKVTAEAFGKDATGHSAFMLQFELDGSPFRLVWPVLPTRSGNERAAKIQAATFLYHDIKARCMASVVLGKRAAFMNFLLLPDGRTAGDVATPEIAAQLPEMFRSQHLLTEK